MAIPVLLLERRNCEVIPLALGVQTESFLVVIITITVINVIIIIFIINQQPLALGI